MSDPWADPTTPTEPGAPYAGPPPTAPQPWPPASQPWPAQQPWPPGAPQPWPPGAPPYGGPPGYGWPPGYPQPWPAYGWPPPRPRRPGAVVAAAVLAFVQTAIALVGTLYTYMLASLVGLGAGQTDPEAEGLAAEGAVLAVVQLLSVVPLVVGGILVLTRRARVPWALLVGSFVVQVLIALYWTLRLSGAIGSEFDAEGRPLVGFTLVFAAAPLVGLGLLTVGAGRRWFTEDPAA